ncbi:MAG TPA: filamentous hemagglutinin N-terminal domain-containing protein, partial [Allocoleopsis sp.]
MTLPVSRVHQLLAVLSVAIGFFSPQSLQAQTIQPAQDGTGTQVTQQGNRFDINGGTQSGVNLFHSFQQFGLDSNQIANFLAKPDIQNILGRVVGGNPSIINGLIQVTSQGNPNLFLVNPAGIIFGQGASLNVPASFMATTATGIQFGNRWFNASGANDYSSLVGNPTAFVFTNTQPGAIINLGNLNVAGGDLTLLGGTVVSTGQLSASTGRLLVAAVPNENLVRISQPGQLLSLEIKPLTAGDNRPSDWQFPVASLPELLTVGSAGNATGVSINPNGQVELTGTGFQIQNGDVVATNQGTAQSATLAAKNNLTLVGSQLTTTGDLNLLASNIVQIRDGAATAFSAQSGGNLYVQGNLGIDILALNSSQTPFQSGGDMSLGSDGIISGDSHFNSGGSFSVLTLAGKPGTFFSKYDPVIISKNDVILGNSTTAALKIETNGNITTGNITIIAPESSANVNANDPDRTALTTTRAVIMRAPNGSITTGNIDTSSAPDRQGSTGSVTVSAQGDIKTGTIDTRELNTGDSGSVNLTTTQGSIETQTIKTSNRSDGSAGNVTLSAANRVTFDRIDTTDGSKPDGTDQPGKAGDVTFSVPSPANVTSPNGNINANIDTRNFGT